ncbi:MAG: hypothetical protein ACQEXQ_15665 [Bacillota bacterium]
MLIRKSVPYYTNNYLSDDGKPSFNRDRSRHRQRDGIIKRDRSPVPNLKINGAENRKSTSHTIKRGLEYRRPAANRKKSSPVPQEMNWNGEQMDSELNELDWLDDQMWNF